MSLSQQLHARARTPAEREWAIIVECMEEEAENRQTWEAISRRDELARYGEVLQ